MGFAGLSQLEGQKLRDRVGPDVSKFHQFFRGILKNHLSKVDMFWVVKWDGDGLEQVDV